MPAATDERLINRILFVPTIRIGISVILTVILAVVSGSLVAAITTSNGLAWHHAIYTSYFKWLVGLVIVQVIWQVKLEQFVGDALKTVKQFESQEYVEAYIKSACIPEAALYLKKLISEGRPTKFADDYHTIMKALK